MGNGIRMIAVFAVSYLLGSLSFAIIVSRLIYKKDIRNFGSGNAGMTNMLRTFGKKAAALTFAGDFLKGCAAVLFAKLVFSAYYISSEPYTPGVDYLPRPAGMLILGSLKIVLDARFYREAAMYVAIVGALRGHLYPVFFGFKGGKGISVAFGAAMTASPLCTLSAFGVFRAVFLLSKMVSLASLACAPSFMIFTLIKFHFTGYFSLPQFVTAIIFPCVIFYSHRSNIKRILSGTEYRFKKKD